MRSNFRLTLVALAIIAAGTLEAGAAGFCQTGANCIANPSFAERKDDDTPDNWRSNVFGESNASFTVTEGRTDSSAGLITVTEATSPQDAKWVFTEVPVVGGQYYVFNDWYKSDQETHIYAYFRGGNTPYIHLMTVPPSENWTQAVTLGFVVPPGATSMTISHNLVGEGTLITDDYSLLLQAPPVFRQGLVSLTFDDGWKSVYDNAIPILDAAGLKSTQYIHTDPVILNPAKYARNMSIDDVLAMQAEGHEIGAHSRTHGDLVKSITNEAARRSEIEGSRSDLLGSGIDRIETFAYPFGSFDEEVRSMASQDYLGARTVDVGYNTAVQDRLTLKTQVILRTTTAAEIKSWIDYALSGNLWLVLTFHRVEPTLADCIEPSGVPDRSCTDVATLQEVVDYLKTLPEGTVRTVLDVLEDKELWAPAVPESPDEIAKIGIAGTYDENVALDPPSTYVGEQLTLEYVMNVAYAAGFQTEEKLLGTLGMAIGESDLWTQARNWHPELGPRPAEDVIGVKGPTGAWSKDGRQIHSDRGLWQISSHWWPSYGDAEADDPAAAAAAIFELSNQGENFGLWDSFRSGRAQAHYDEAYSGWPALRPLVKNFLKRVADGEIEIAVKSAPAEPNPEAQADIPTLTLDAPMTAPGVARAQDHEKAMAALVQAAAAGNAWAQIGLAEMLVKGEHADADPERAVELLKEAAASGLKGPALGTLGAYYRSIGDFEKAYAALEEAADAGNGFAQQRLAEMLLKGEGQAADPKRAVGLFEQAAANGLTGPAYKALAQYYRGVADYSRMFAALEQAAAVGEMEAKLLLGKALIKGDGVPNDAERGVAMLEEAADGEFAGQALAALGDYYRGAGDQERARNALEKAADAGAPEAKLALGEMLIKGDGGPADPERAIALLEEAAEAGLTGKAFKHLADYYMANGNDERALKALEAAAGGGNAEAKLLLGETLIKGDTAAAEHAVALLEEAAADGFAERAYGILAEHYSATDDTSALTAVLEKAAEAGNAEAKLKLGVLLTDADQERAVALIEEAAEAGLGAPAFKALADHYRKIGDTRELADALEQAADAGDAPAKVELADMLLKGEVVQADRKRARDLLESALQQESLPHAYTGLITLTAADMRKGESPEASLNLLRQAYAADATVAYDAVANLGENDKTAVVQAVLSDAKIYTGPTNGRLNETTLNAIGKFCKENNIVTECRNEALSSALISAVLRHLSAEG